LPRTELRCVFSDTFFKSWCIRAKLPQRLKPQFNNGAAAGLEGLLHPVTGYSEAEKCWKPLGSETEYMAQIERMAEQSLRMPRLYTRKPKPSPLITLITLIYPDQKSSIGLLNL
jgi:hypothetical protein